MMLADRVRRFNHAAAPHVQMQTDDAVCLPRNDDLHTIAQFPTLHTRPCARLAAHADAHPRSGVVHFFCFEQERGVRWAWGWVCCA